MVKLCLLDQKRLRMTNFGNFINCCVVFVFVFVFICICESCDRHRVKTKTASGEGGRDNRATFEGQQVSSQIFCKEVSQKLWSKQIYNIGNYTENMEPLKETTIQFEARRMVALEQQVCWEAEEGEEVHYRHSWHNSTCTCLDALLGYAGGGKWNTVVLS